MFKRSSVVVRLYRHSKRLNMIRLTLPRGQLRSLCVVNLESHVNSLTAGEESVRLGTDLYENNK